MKVSSLLYFLDQIRPFQWNPIYTWKNTATITLSKPPFKTLLYLKGQLAFLYPILQMSTKSKSCKQYAQEFTCPSQTYVPYYRSPEHDLHKRRVFAVRRLQSEMKLKIIVKMHAEGTKTQQLRVREKVSVSFIIIMYCQQQCYLSLEHALLKIIIFQIPTVWQNSKQSNGKSVP